MVERQIVEVKSSRVIDFVVGVIILKAKRAVELAEVDGEATPQRKDIRSVRLEEIAVDLGSRLVLRPTLQCLRILTEHKIHAASIPSARGNVRSPFQDEPQLI